MPDKQDENNPQEGEQPQGVRRGKGLRLSVETPPAEEGEAVVGNEQAQAVRPAQRGKGLRLSVETPPAEDAPPAPRPRPARRSKKKPAVEPSPAEEAPPAPTVEPVVIEAAPAEEAAPVPIAEPVVIETAPAEEAVPIAEPVVIETAPAEPTKAAPASAEPAPLEKAGERLPLPAPELARLGLRRGRVSYREAGSGPPLILLHGWGASSQMWLDTMERLGDIRHSYALDLPGFGESPTLAGGPDLAPMAEVVLNFADALGLERFDLCGHSFGAAVAATFAAHYPARVARMALVAFGVRPNAPERMALKAVQAPFNLTAGLLRPWLNLWQPWTRFMMKSSPMPQVMSSWLLDHAPADDRQWREYVAELAANDPRAYLAYLVSTSDPALIEALGRITAPTQIMLGRNDRQVGLTGLTSVQELIPRSRLVIFDACGHLPMLDQPGPFHDALRTFLKG